MTYWISEDDDFYASASDLYGVEDKEDNKTKPPTTTRDSPSTSYYRTPDNSSMTTGDNPSTSYYQPPTTTRDNPSTSYYHQPPDNLFESILPPHMSMSGATSLYCNEELSFDDETPAVRVVETRRHAVFDTVFDIVSKRDPVFYRQKVVNNMLKTERNLLDKLKNVIYDYTNTDDPVISEEYRNIIIRWMDEYITLQSRGPETTNVLPHTVISLDRFFGGEIREGHKVSRYDVPIVAMCCLEKSAKLLLTDLYEEEFDLPTLLERIPPQGGRDRNLIKSEANKYRIRVVMEDEYTTVAYDFIDIFVYRLNEKYLTKLPSDIQMRANRLVNPCELHLALACKPQSLLAACAVYTAIALLKRNEGETVEYDNFVDYITNITSYDITHSDECLHVCKELLLISYKILIEGYVSMLKNIYLGKIRDDKDAQKIINKCLGSNIIFLNNRHQNVSQSLLSACIIYTVLKNMGEYQDLDINITDVTSHSVMSADSTAICKEIRL